MLCPIGKTQDTILQEQELTSNLGVAYLCTKLEATAEDRVIAAKLA